MPRPDVPYVVSGPVVTSFDDGRRLSALVDEGDAAGILAECGPAGVAESWLAYHRADERSFKSNDWWAPDLLLNREFWFLEPPVVARTLCALLERTRSDDELDFVAAGPIEQLLRGSRAHAVLPFLLSACQPELVESAISRVDLDEVRPENLALLRRLGLA